jgi:hypothetical protein
MTHFVGLDVSQKMTAICVVDDASLAADYGGASTRFQNRSAFWSAGMREMTLG